MYQCHTSRHVMKLAALGMILVTGVLYQLCSKAIPEDINPFLPLMGTYVVAFITALLLFVLTKGASQFSVDIKKINVFCLLLGAVICFYELGFVLAYRNGFSLTTLPPIANILVIVAVCAVGVFFFAEKISLLHLGGLILAVTGIVITIL